MRILIVYSTRYGATTQTAEEIANILLEEGFQVRIIDLGQESINDVRGFDLIVIGSGVKNGKWVRHARRFLKKFRIDLGKKKIALFISSGWEAIARAEGDMERIEDIYQTQLVNRAEDHGLHPIALGLFNGIWDFTSVSGFKERWYREVKERIEGLGFKANGDRYDLRDWNKIRAWARELAKKARE